MNEGKAFRFTNLFVFLEVGEPSQGIIDEPQLVLVLLDATLRHYSPPHTRWNS